MSAKLRKGPSGPVDVETGDHKVLVTGADTTPGFLSAKTQAGANIVLTVLSPGADEKLEVKGTGGFVTGPPKAVAYYDLLGGISGDPLLTAIPVDQFGRAQIRDIRQPTGPGSGAVLRQGAWVADGDSSNVQGEGLVVYGPAPNGMQDAANGTIGRVKYNRFQIRLIIGGFDVGSAWRVDPTHEFFTNDLGVMTAEIERSTGNAFFGRVGTGGAAGPKWMSGAGSPETVVTGSPGDLYSNTSGGAGTTLYVKESGVATNTGWVGK